MVDMKACVLVAIVLLGGGCATPPEHAPEKWPYLMTSVIAASPGKYFAYDLPIGTSEKNEVSVAFKELRPSNNWAPTISFCFHSGEPEKEQTCFNLVVTKDGNQVNPQVFIHPAGKNYISRYLPASFETFKPITVQIARTNGQVIFSIKGEELFRSEEAFKAKQVSFSCSSAVCSFDILR
jgi:hypothetical protein